MTVSVYAQAPQIAITEAYVCKGPTDPSCIRIDAAGGGSGRILADCYLQFRTDFTPPSILNSINAFLDDRVLPPPTNPFTHPYSWILMTYSPGPLTLGWHTFKEYFSTPNGETNEAIFRFDVVPSLHGLANLYGVSC
jgi:hypothetical protein